jgi:cytoskeletal protein CcmA (bactofilin family)
MKIFSDSKASDNNASTAISSIIGQDMAIIGDLTFKSKIQLDGNLQGNLSGTFLVLSESGKIIGDVVAESMVCYGKVDGNVKAGKLFLKKTGVINGRVETSDLSVESGGILNGEIKAQTQSRDLKVVNAAKTKADSVTTMGSPSLTEPQKA